MRALGDTAVTASPVPSPSFVEPIQQKPISNQAQRNRMIGRNDRPWSNLRTLVKVAILKWEVKTGEDVEFVFPESIDFQTPTRIKAGSGIKVESALSTAFSGVESVRSFCPEKISPSSSGGASQRDRSMRSQPIQKLPAQTRRSKLYFPGLAFHHHLGHYWAGQSRMSD